jgi:hypothetical protein
MGPLFDVHDNLSSLFILRSLLQLACLKMYELAKQKIAAKQREKELEAEEGEREAKRRGFKAYKVRPA